MKKTHTNIYIAVGTLWVLCFSPRAFAYLDPGTGSAILQGILAAFAALVVTAKLYWHRLLRLFGLRKEKSVEQDKP